MRQFKRMALFLLLLLLAACQTPPPTQIVIVISPTPDGNTQTPYVIVVTATPQGAPTGTATSDPALTNTQMPARITLTPSATPDIFPTSTINQIQIAEQIFESGRMFWLQPTRQIWVLIDRGDGSGRWLIFDDTFAEGDPESDPNILPPDGFMQPVRGFGKLWRENRVVRESLGWALGAEVGYISRYEYHPGGTVSADGVYTDGPGYHLLFSQADDIFRFDAATFTWSTLTQPALTPTP